MNKNDHKLYIAAIVLGLVAVFIVYTLINIIRVNMIRFEYYKDGEFGISNKCYYDNKKECLCKIDGKYEQVESYYEV